MRHVSLNISCKAQIGTVKLKKKEKAKSCKKEEDMNENKRYKASMQKGVGSSSIYPDWEAKIEGYWKRKSVENNNACFLIYHFIQKTKVS